MEYSMKFTILLSLLSFSFAVLQEKFNSCGKDEDVITLSVLQIIPSIPQAGKQVTIAMGGTLNRPINQGALVKISAKIGIVVVKTQYMDSAELSTKRGLEFPILPKDHPGEFVIPVSYMVPDDCPAGVTFILKVEAFNGNGTGVDRSDGILCWSGPINVAPLASS